MQVFSPLSYCKRAEFHFIPCCMSVFVQEIVAAMECGCNIIPLLDNFHWPQSEKLPEDMRQITFFNGIRQVVLISLS